MQYQVPLELLVLARNREKDQARSVAVTPVAPRPNADEPPPSSELSALRVRPNAAPPIPESAEADPGAAGDEQLAGSESAVPIKSSSVATLALFLIVALCLIAGYCILVVAP